MKRQGEPLEHKRVKRARKQKSIISNTYNHDESRKLFQNMLVMEQEQVLITRMKFPIGKVVADPEQIINFQAEFHPVATTIGARDISDYIFEICNINLDMFTCQVVVDYLKIDLVDCYQPQVQKMFELDVSENIKRKTGKATPAILNKFKYHKSLAVPNIFAKWRCLYKTSIAVVSPSQLVDWKSAAQDRKDVTFLTSTCSVSNMDIPVGEKEYVLDYMTQLSSALFEEFQKYKLIVMTPAVFDKFALASFRCDLVFGRVFFYEAHDLKLPSCRLVHAYYYWATSSEPEKLSLVASSKQNFLRWMLTLDKRNFNVVKL